MREFLNRNNQLVLMVLVWVVCGNILTELAMGVVVISVLLLKRKNFYTEMILGFMIILLFSDSKMTSLEFAKEVKDIYLILLTLFLIFDWKNFRQKNIMFVSFLPFIIWAMIVVINSPIMMTAFQKSLSYGLLFLVAPYYFGKVMEEKGTQFLRDYIWVLVCILLAGILIYIVDPAAGAMGTRFRGINRNPNGMGVFTLMATFVMAVFSMKNPGLFSKKETIFTYALIFICMIMAGSRNSIFSVLIFFLFVHFYKVSYWAGFIITIIAILLYQVVMANMTDILQALGLAKALRADTLESGSGRVVAWGFAWKIINSSLSQFFLGGGWAFEEHIFGVYKSALNKMGHIGGVHNSYLGIWLNTGIIGLILWFYGFLRSIFQAAKNSFLAFPLAYAFIESWLLGSLNPFTIIFISLITYLAQAPVLSTENVSPPPDVAGAKAPLNPLASH
jgi:O-antigen ligase